MMRRYWAKASNLTASLNGERRIFDAVMVVSNQTRAIRSKFSGIWYLLLSARVQRVYVRRGPKRRCHASRPLPVLEK